MSAVIATLYLISIFGLIGLGISRLFFLRYKPPAFYFLHIWLGISFSALTIAIAWLIGLDLFIAFTIIILLSIIGLFLRIQLQFRNKISINLGYWLSQLAKNRELKFLSISLVLVLLVMSPLSVHGLGYWTLGTGDYPSYVASSQIWINGENAFREIHSQKFADGMISRASYEKPATTGLLVFVEFLGINSLTSIFPIMATLLIGTAYSTMTAISRITRLNTATIAAVLAFTTLGVIPISRALDAQPGHIMMVTMAMTSLAFLLVIVRSKSSSHLILSSLPMATAALSNFTLFVGTIPITAGATLILLSTNDRFLGKLTAKSFLVFSVGTLTLTSFFLTQVSRSFIGQTGTSAGFDIPFAPLWSLLGIAESYRSWGNESVILTSLTWVLFLIPFAFVFFKKGFEMKALAIAAFLGVGNIFLIALFSGSMFDDYRTHKSITVFAVILLPFLVASLIDKIVMRSLPIVQISTFSLGFISLGLVISVSSSVSNFIDEDDIRSIKSNRSNLENLQVMQNPSFYSEPSILSLAISSKTTLISQTYSGKEKVILGLPFLVKTKDAKNNEMFSIVDQISSSYSIADVVFDTNYTSSVGSEIGDSRLYLEEGWHASESWGSWSTQNAKLAISLDDANFSRVTLDGSFYSPEGAPSKPFIILSGSGQVLKSGFYSYGNQPELSFELPFVNGKADLNLRLIMPEAASPSDFGSSDKRFLGFSLRGVQFH